MTGGIRQEDVPGGGLISTNGLIGNYLINSISGERPGEQPAHLHPCHQRHRHKEHWSVLEVGMVCSEFYEIN